MGVVIIQKTFRGFLQRKKYVDLRTKTIRIQRLWKAYAAKRRYRRVNTYLFSVLVVDVMKAKVDSFQD